MCRLCLSYLEFAETTHSSFETKQQFDLNICSITSGLLHCPLMESCQSFISEVLLNMQSRKISCTMNCVQVELVGMSYVGLKAVVDFLYSGELMLDGRNFDFVLEAAHLLQVKPLNRRSLNFLMSFLYSHYDTFTCFCVFLKSQLL